jgi:hypothetical protein
MKASPEQIASLRTVARALGTLNKDVVYVGGITASLLVTDPGAPTGRPTQDVDLVIEVASRTEYQTKLRKRLIRCGFREDSREGAPICRWLLGQIVVDIMPIRPGVLGFSNEWYEHARTTAKMIALPRDDDGVVSIQVVAGPAFCATKVVAWKNRGGGDLLHSDIEDIIAVVDGRPELLGEIEADIPELRRFLAESVRGLLAAGLEDQISGHLEGDGASQGRAPSVIVTLHRIARCPTIVRLRHGVTARSGGDPGATSVPPGSAWDWKVLAIERAIASTPPPGRSHVAVVAQLRSHSMTAGTTSDGRDVFVEDWMGRRFSPLDKLVREERRKRQMPAPDDQFIPRETFDTVWVYELPAGAKGLRLLLPFDSVELPFDLPV